MCASFQLLRIHKSTPIDIEFCIENVFFFSFFYLFDGYVQLL